MKNLNLDIKKLRKDFPIFRQKINGHPLVYLDSAATSQKPTVVLDAMQEYYTSYNANVRRGLYPLAEKATAKVEEVRKKVAKFINARFPEEVLFVRNSTEGINLVMNSWGRQNIKKGQVITTTIVEHHSNFVPWQQLAKEKQLKLEILDIDDEGFLRIKNHASRIADSELFAVTHISNVLGTINPVHEIIQKLRTKNHELITLVDGAQSVPHMKVDVQKMDCDFLVFSGHKLLASTGIGVLYGKKELLDAMQPFLLGSDMIKEVYIDRTVFNNAPSRFEAGTPDIAGIVSLGAAIDYIESIGMENIQNHESGIMKYALEKLKKIDGLTLYGPEDPKNRSGVISFNLEGIHPHDVAQVLGDMGICIRAGHHCAMPLHTRLGISASARASFYIYNNEEDIDSLIKGLKKVKTIFA